MKLDRDRRELQICSRPPPRYLVAAASPVVRSVLHMAAAYARVDPRNVVLHTESF